MNRSQSFAVLDKLSRIEQQSWPKYKSAVPNWFIRQTLNVPDLIIRFGSCKVWRLNWALNRVLSVSHLFTPPPRGSQLRKVYCGGGGGQRQSAVILDCQYLRPIIIFWIQFITYFSFNGPAAPLINYPLSQSRTGGNVLRTYLYYKQ